MTIAYGSRGGDVYGGYGVGAAPDTSVTQSVPVPSGTTAGDMLVMVLAGVGHVSGGAIVGSSAFTVPSGWTQLFTVEGDTDTYYAADTRDRLDVWYKTAGSSESAASVTGGAAFDNYPSPNIVRTQWAGEMFRFTGGASGVVSGGSEKFLTSTTLTFSTDSVVVPAGSRGMLCCAGIHWPGNMSFNSANGFSGVVSDYNTWPSALYPVEYLATRSVASSGTYSGPSLTTSSSYRGIFVTFGLTEVAGGWKVGSV